MKGQGAPLTPHLHLKENTAKRSVHRALASPVCAKPVPGPAAGMSKCKLGKHLPHKNASKLMLGLQIPSQSSGQGYLIYRCLDTSEALVPFPLLFGSLTMGRRNSVWNHNK